MAAYSRRSSRRSMVKGTVAGVAGLAGIVGVGGGAYLLTQKSSASHAAGVTPPPLDSIQTILNIAATAEEGGVVFYTQALLHAERLGLGERAFQDLRAAQVEEQLHLSFLLKQGARPLSNTFSFPFGKATFTNFELFIRTQQALETAHAAAYLAAIREFALLNRPDLALIAGEIATVESEHRAIGRAIGGLSPANNQAFTPALFPTVSAAAAALQKAGFLTPRNGNSFRFQPASVNFNGVSARVPTTITTTTTTPAIMATPTATSTSTLPITTPTPTVRPTPPKF